MEHLKASASPIPYSATTRLVGRDRLVTMKPTHQLAGCHSTLATTRRFLFHDPA